MMRKRRLRANVRYFLALLGRFYVTAILAVALFGLVPLVFWARYRTPDGHGIDYGEAFNHVYFLLYGQPSLAYVDDWVLEVLNVLVPPLGIAVIADGVVRFAFLYFAKHRSDKEWIAVISKTMKGHVVVAGAGRVGYRVAAQLLELQKEVVVIEKREDAAFVQALRDQGVPVLVEDSNSPKALERMNMKDAAALVCATDDDLANMNLALDARRHNPTIRVVMRLFDDDLVARVRDAFQAEAHSTSALAAPALALAALDPRIRHSFRIGSHLIVVSDFRAAGPLLGMSIAEVRDRFGGLVLALKRGAASEVLHPKGELKLDGGDELTVQLAYEEYLGLRRALGEESPPVHERRG